MSEDIQQLSVFDYRNRSNKAEVKRAASDDDAIENFVIKAIKLQR